MTLREQATWWGVGLIVFVIIMLLLSNVLTPFIMGVAIAYFVDPVADRLEARGLSRLLATIVISCVSFFVIGLLFAIVPFMVGEELTKALDAVPSLVGRAQEFLEGTLFPLLNIELQEGNALSEAFRRFQGEVQDITAAILNSALSIGLAGVEFVTLLVITPVVAFYLLLDWDNMVERIDDLLPREHAATIREIARQIDAVLAGFVRGQLTVCLILGVFYAFSLWIVGLNFGVIVGLFAGLISFIPFIGSILGGVLSIGIALFQYWDTQDWLMTDWVSIAIVGGIFVIGQVVEGNYLSPKLVGGSVGLHPVWLMFALSAFGALFGFTGLLIAVPTAAVIGVLLRFSVAQYKQGRLYRGVGEE